MELLYHIRPYFGGRFPYIDLIYGRYLQFLSVPGTAIDETTNHIGSIGG
jgi:hypothetical protein